MARATFRAKVAAATFATLAPLFFLETALRAIDYDPLRALRERRGAGLRASSAPDVVYELTPLYTGPAWGTQVAINSLGFRGPEISPAKGDSKRIAVLGDSITFGNFLPAEAVYPRVTGRLLAAEARERRFEVLNLGVGGYDVLQETASLRHKWMALRPDVVVVGFCLNDAGIASPNRQFVEAATYLASSPVLRARSAQLAVNALHNLSGVVGYHSRANDPSVFAEAYEDRIDPLDPETRALVERVRSSDLPRFRSSIPYSDRLILEFYSDPAKVGRIRWAFRDLDVLSREHGFRVVVLIFPWLVSDGGAYPFAHAHEIIQAEARRRGFEVLDLRQAFQSAGFDKLLRRGAEADHCHPNELGHEVAARALAPLIAR